MNLFAYVSNRPTLFVDPDGRLLVGSIVGAVAGGVAGAIASYGTSGGKLVDTLLGFASGAAVGAALGLLDPTEGIGAIAALGLVSGAAGAAGDYLGQKISILLSSCPKKKVNLSEVVWSGYSAG